MKHSTFLNICFTAVLILRECAPIDTGNLRYNAIRFKTEGNKFIIYIDESIAPYVFYTNEPWISPKWNGKKNPNQGWFDKAVEKIAQMVATMSKGNLEVEGV